MASDRGWPVVQPLPKIIVQLVLAISLVSGHVLLWNERRATKAVKKRAAIDSAKPLDSAKPMDVEKPLGLPAYK